MSETPGEQAVQQLGERAARDHAVAGEPEAGELGGGRPALGDAAQVGDVLHAAEQRGELGVVEREVVGAEEHRGQGAQARVEPAADEQQPMVLRERRGESDEQLDGLAGRALDLVDDQQQRALVGHARGGQHGGGVRQARAAQASAEHADQLVGAGDAALEHGLGGRDPQRAAVLGGERATCRSRRPPRSARPERPTADVMRRGRATCTRAP